MPTRPPPPCSWRTTWPRCDRPGTERGLCPEHRAEQRAQADAARGSSTKRGYGRRHRSVFRPGVLRRDPVCVCPGCPECAGAAPGRACWRLSTEADHHPRTRKELVAQGADPDDPAHGRGLCKPCHDRHTATSTPGGWAAR